jgi:hypothetical protein
MIKCLQVAPQRRTKGQSAWRSVRLKVSPSPCESVPAVGALVKRDPSGLLRRKHLGTYARLSFNIHVERENKKTSKCDAGVRWLVSGI